jgi:trigger factor
MFADIRRGLAIAAAVEAATVTDSDGNVVDTTEFFGKRAESETVEDEVDADDLEAAASSEEPSGDTK